MKAVATIAAVGTAATVMYVAQDAMPAGNFLAKEMTPMQKEFAAYVAKFNKSYATQAEYEARFGLFAKRHHEIAQHNMQGKSWTLAHNHMSDWTVSEQKFVNGYKPVVRTTEAVKEEFPVDAPSSVNWQDKLASMKVIKNQGQCGSCWAFSTVGSIESATEISTGIYTSLSEQQLVDCSTWNNGCGGGNFDLAFEYEKSNGAMTESDYPYTAQDGTCAFEASKVANKSVTGYTDVAQWDSASLKKALLEGPVSIAIQANQYVFQSYSSGVIANDGSCGEELDHAVLAIGYGVENGKRYFLVRNSWGNTWGDNGLVKLGYNSDSAACGAVDQPSKVHVK